MSQDQIKKQLDAIIQKSKMDNIEVYYEEHESSSTRFSSNVITQNLSGKDKKLTIKVLDNNKVGIAESNDLSESAIERTLEKAKISASFQKENPDLLPLAEPQTYYAIEHYDEKLEKLDPVTKAEWIKKAVEKGKEYDFECSGIFTHGWKNYTIANSKGLFAQHKYSHIDFNLSMEKGEQSGWYEQSSYKLDNIDLDFIINKALDTTLKTKNPISLEPGNYTVIFSPEAVGELIYFLAFDGLNTLGQIEKANFFHDKFNEKVFSDKLSFWDDTTNNLAGGLPFDFEGMPRKKIKLIDKGVFKDRVLDRKLAQELKLESTGHSLPQPNSYGPLPLNLVMETGDQSIEEMVKSTDYGLYVNRLHYTNILDPMTLNLTGMTRDGLFLIEKGEITKPVKNFRFTESLVKAFNNVEAVENQSTFIRSFFGGGFVLSGLKIKDFHFSSKTEF